ncbi:MULTISPECIES: amino acid ABC transporter ATP-binding protein [unclassified Rothia (in: high G+C Gram-positive bacteria)]|uniref:amino acid ABC transporter ATP-binding protein n=1 Tax=unclassified Rothia (in: high G+C Gram-positive bacteria) TaxID=2689056 RepID=UPI001959B11C|nr:MULTISPECIES: amino acid ABC transporter ATP-binding protein [unclassified Rothia (in: high G+C Gram-positive bacteria)]MBM7052149.1 amino acid ABC transporter ATP-binding protein [Rothia sp. ZJ1223]QRZ61418.1 amino acid ABC transporter ATP-binding protein [Rothia sp. ZJ932]
MLSLDHLTKSFGDNTVLNNISLELTSGETTVILGPSGSGKSTLLRCLNLLETPESGSLSIEGDRIDFGSKLTDEQVRTIRKHSAMVFQNFNLFPHYTAAQNVALAPVLNGKMGQKEADALALSLLEKVGLGEKKDSYPDNLSGGQQQRVAIARALAVSPDYLLFDEPTSALDPELEAEVIRVLMNLAKENRSLVVVTHNMAFAQRVADRIIFLEGGNLLYNGEPKGFFNSDNERIKQFLQIFEMSDYRI